MVKSVIISIDGNIGSGKTTFVKELSQRLNENNGLKYIYLQEPVDEWEKVTDNNNVSLLKKFYQDVKSYAFSFQMMAFISRISLLRRTLEAHPENHVIICERSVFTDKNVFAKMLYNQGLIEEVNYKIYNMWFDELIRDIQFNKVIYLNTGPSSCLKRIKTRNRTGEESISEEYLQTLNDYHLEWLSTEANVLEIDGELPINECVDHGIDMIASITL